MKALLALSWRYLWSRPLTAALNLLLLTLGLAAITLVLLVGTQIDRALERDAQGIDLVVGAKGSPLQLIFAGIFHIDVPPGNIPLADFEALRQHPLVAQAIPLSLGDSYAGFRIVGTTHDYPRHYGATLAAGQWWGAPMQAVLGAEVARRAWAGEGAASVLGQHFAGAHGLGGGGHAHADHPYTVVGVLQRCGCVLDRLVLTATESVWQVHEEDGADPQDTESLQALREAREVTLALVRYRTPLAAVTLPRYVNAQTTLQAASPALEVSRLMRLLGVGAEALHALGAVLLGVAALAVFIALWNAVRERRADMALMRLLGAPPRRVAALLACEALWLALLASALGLLAGHALAELVGRMLAAQGSLPVHGRIWLAQELLVPLWAVAVALLAALVPTWQAWRTDVAELLARA